MFYKSISLIIANPILTVYEDITEEYWTQQRIEEYRPFYRDFYIIIFYFILFFYPEKTDEQNKLKVSHNKMGNKPLQTVH